MLRVYQVLDIEELGFTGPLTARKMTFHNLSEIYGSKTQEMQSLK